MREVDFFSSTRGVRSAAERLQKMAGMFDNEAAFTSDYWSFGFDYFDNPDLKVGYGGYVYDGRFREVVDRICTEFGLGPGDHVLEVGCAKGYLLTEFLGRGINVAGLDKSPYAAGNAHLSVRASVVVGNICNMPFRDGLFDLIIAKDTLPHVERELMPAALRECQRVGCGAMLFDIPTGGTVESLEYIRRWDPTHLTLETPEWWKDCFDKLNISPHVNFLHLFPDAA